MSKIILETCLAKLELKVPGLPENSILQITLELEAARYPRRIAEEDETFGISILNTEAKIVQTTEVEIKIVD